MRETILIFGCDAYALQIAQNLVNSNHEVYLFTLYQEKVESLQKAIPQMKVSTFDLSDNWQEIEKYNQKNLLIYCALCDEAKNLFLTISLRTSFEDIVIIALASDHEHAEKLKIAGANKAIVTAQITANILYEYINNPSIYQLMEDILYDNSELKISQITVSSKSKLIGKKVIETKALQEKYSVILLALIDESFNTLFTFTKKGVEHEIKQGDILITIGKIQDIKNFKEVVGEHYKIDWHRWRWQDDE